MKKVSAKMFFTVLWRGVCQGLGWFFGLFGYKRDGKFAKCVWGLFATSFAVIAVIIAYVTVMCFWEELGRRYGWGHDCSGATCHLAQYISGNIYYHHGTGRAEGYVFNVGTGKKLIDDVDWIAEPEDDDSLVCFSDGKKRGYFNKHTGEVIVRPKYTHAWIFSDGLAAVEENGTVKFIDGTGKVKIDLQLPYDPENEGYVFHDGYCLVQSHNSTRFGVVDTAGKWAVPMEYDYIKDCRDEELWLLKKGNMTTVLNCEFEPVLTLSAGCVFIGDGTVDVTLPDHTMRKYDRTGALISDFYISGVCMLEYEKTEIVYCKNTTSDDGDYGTENQQGYYHPKATARLRAYTAGDGYEGLMTADGHPVTMPLYKEIAALDYDLYLCSCSNYDKVIVNGKGEVVK